ncbi:MAG: hypothetical protein IJG37_07795 [Synergistaceae bacterium]|nr:hypothetical protein [Synergistaceae bacterium]
MSYNTDHTARIRDIYRFANQIKGIIDELETRVEWLEELSTSILGVTNAVITNISGEE